MDDSIEDLFFDKILGGNMDEIRSLISQGADVNYMFPSGETPLTLCFKHRDIECIKLLVDNGANVNLAPLESAPPILQAVFFYKGFTPGSKDQTSMIEIINYLLEKGADPRISWYRFYDGNHVAIKIKDFLPTKNPLYGSILRAAAVRSSRDMAYLSQMRKDHDYYFSAIPNDIVELIADELGRF